MRVGSPHPSFHWGLRSVVATREPENRDFWKFQRSCSVIPPQRLLVSISWYSLRVMPQEADFFPQNDPSAEIIEENTFVGPFVLKTALWQLPLNLIYLLPTTKEQL